jgi:hypothetical protein
MLDIQASRQAGMLSTALQRNSERVVADFQGSDCLLPFIGLSGHMEVMVCVWHKTEQGTMQLHKHVCILDDWC